MVDLPESTWPMTTMLIWVFSFGIVVGWLAAEERESGAREPRTLVEMTHVLGLFCVFTAKRGLGMISLSKEASKGRPRCPLTFCSG